MAVDGGVVERVRRGRLVVGRSLVGRATDYQHFGERAVIGALALGAGTMLLAVGAVRLSALLRPNGTASFLLGAYVAGVAAARRRPVGAVALRLGDEMGTARRPRARVRRARARHTRGWSDVGVRLRDGGGALRSGSR